MLTIAKIEIIEIDKDEVKRREETMARLIFTAARRKLKNSKSISLLQNSINDFTSNLKKELDDETKSE